MASDPAETDPGTATGAGVRTILTCAQPTGRLHLGNYLGAVKNWVALQSGYRSFFGIVDLHAITVPYTPADLRRQTLECAAQYLACGLDPERCDIFIQSHVVGHTELAWVLGCLTPVGRLQRMTQFKDKASQEGAEIGSGLLTYPVLMAADILLYNAHLVPVGDDQKQHLELARDIAEKFNRVYSPTFNVPEGYHGPVGARIMALQDPGRKMSKSDPNQGSTLNLTDPPDLLRKKIKSAVTDSGTEVRAAPDKPGVSNLLQIFAAASGRPVPDLEAGFAGRGYGEFKAAVADAVVDLLAPIQGRYHQLLEDKGHLQDVLRRGAAAAQKQAYKTLAKVYKKAGFVERPR